MKRLTTPDSHHDGGIAIDSAGTRRSISQLGFRPAFLDFATQTIYPSQFADGRPAPVHRLDGLPDQVVVVRAPCGWVIAVKATLIEGFERDGFFYTRSSAERAAREWV